MRGVLDQELMDFSKPNLSKSPISPVQRFCIFLNASYRSHAIIKSDILT